VSTHKNKENFSLKFKHKKMKNILLALAATVVTALVATKNASAQIAMSNAKTSAKSSKVTLVDVNSGLGVANNNALTNVNEKALKNFQNSFKGANATWSQAEDGGFIARFTENSIETVCAYSAKGKLNHTILYYQEKDLPEDIRATVKSSYYDFDILSVAEVHIDDSVIYMLTLQDDKRIKWLRVTDDSMQEVKNYVRQ
jgi:hypothetical protein